jgi:hypothetical protein
MADLPIIFSAPMVSAMLACLKTMTRRILSPQPQVFMIGDEPAPVDIIHVDGDPRPRICVGRCITTQEVKYAVGDRLWVRENFRNQQTSRITAGDGARRLVCIDYAADGTRIHWNLPEIDCPKILLKRGAGPSGEQTKLLPCIHMPQIISRLTLVVSAVKIERVQDISEADAIAEGVKLRWLKATNRAPRPHYFIDAGNSIEHSGGSAREAFERLWDKLHGPKSWEANPYVVAVTYSVYKQNIEGLKAAA